MSDASGNGSPNGAAKRRMEEAMAARGRADLVSGLRGLAKGPRTGPARRAPAAGSLGAMQAEAGGAAAPGGGAEAEEFCEICNAPLGSDHRHLLHLDERRMICACETCWSVRSGEAAYRPAGVRTAWVEDLDLPDEAWNSFRIPIGLAFFMKTGDPEKVYAFYPSPAGATESEIDEAAWARFQALNPVLERLEPDSEALIINRISDTHQFVIAPIDECYRLVGMIKVSWEGISGGTGPQEAIERFFIELRIKGAVMSRTDARA